MLALTVPLNDRDGIEPALLDGVTFILPDGRLMRVVMRRKHGSQSLCKMLIEAPRDVQILRDSAVRREKK